MENKYISKREKKKKYFDISDEIINQHNEKFIQKEKKKLKNYFDNMFLEVDSSIRLDQEQIEAIIVDEDYEMIIAGAGSGKTTTMTAKVKYLVEKRNIDPNDIMIISYTNEAVNELKERINGYFHISTPITTFHKLCFDIIKRDGKTFEVVEENNKIISSYFNKKRKKYKKYLFYHNIKYYLLYVLKRQVRLEDINLCIQFINRFKTNGYYLNDLILKYKNSRKINSFLYLIKDVYNYYQKYMKKNNLIDFDTMICLCLKKLKKVTLKYKYLIVDEYQDISYLRFQLIYQISKLYHTKIIVVGDDFQSIYSFSGSDLSLFVDFKEKMGYAKYLKITNTYRNSQELIDIIGNFIMKNTNQISKKLNSFKHLNNPVILVSYKNNKLKKIKNCIQIIIREYGERKNILILGRYKHDVDIFKNSNDFILKNNNQIIYNEYPHLKILFMSIHSSKGLGFDNVIIINNENSLYGFPSKIKNHKYLKIINKNKEKYPYAEERRLFYVALTRTKNKVYLIYPKNNPSIFIREIKLILQFRR